MLSYAHDLHLLKTRVQNARHYSKRGLTRRWHSLQKHLWEKVKCGASDQVARSDSNSQPSNDHSSAVYHDPKVEQHEGPSVEGCGTASQWTVIHLQKEVKFWFMPYRSTLKLNIQKTKIMAYGPITSWQIDGETMETGTDFIFLGSKITADGDCSQEIKRPLLLGRKAMTNLDSILKSRYHVANKDPCSQSYGFSSSHACMWKLDYKKCWMLKNW